MLFRKISCAFKLFWLGFTHPTDRIADLLSEIAALKEELSHCVNVGAPREVGTSATAKY